MPFIDYEHLRAAARLEPPRAARARRSSSTRRCSARVHDPLWMLARQWQFGEFKGEDTGSAVLAKLARRVDAGRARSAIGDGGVRRYEDRSLPARGPGRAPADRLPADRRARALGPAASCAARRGGGRRAPPAPAPPSDADGLPRPVRAAFPIDADGRPADADGRRAGARAPRGRAHRTRRGARRAARSTASRCTRRCPRRRRSADLPAELAAGIHPDHAGIVLAALDALSRLVRRALPDGRRPARRRLGRGAARVPLRLHGPARRRQRWR